MARTRNIKPGFFKNEELAECDPLARILFAGLWTIADREGRLEDRPKRIKAELLPYDVANADELLDQLARHGFIVRYQVEGLRYIEIATFTKNQQPHVNEAPSTIPAPDDNPSNKEEYGTSTVQVPEQHDANTPLTLTSTLTRTSSLNLVTAPAGADDVSLPTHTDNFSAWFDEFWTLYPKKVRKQSAIKAARYIAVRDWDDVILSVKHYVLSTKPLEGYAKEPPGYLSDGFWKDYVTGPIIEKRGTNGTSRLQPTKREQAIHNGFKDAFGISLDEAFGGGNGRATENDPPGNLHQLPGAREAV
jgi:hypothetical protein